MSGGRPQFRLLAVPIALPLIVECVTLIVPVNRPVIDILTPMLHSLLNLCRYVIGWHDEIGQFQNDIVLFDLEINRGSCEFEKSDISLLDSSLLQHLSWNLFEGHI